MVKLILSEKNKVPRKATTRDVKPKHKQIINKYNTVPTTHSKIKIPMCKSNKVYTTGLICWKLQNADERKKRRAR